MPELPDVEAARLKLSKTIQRQRIMAAFCASDPIVYKKQNTKTIASKLKGKKIIGTGRKGKYFWLILEDDLWLVMHFGMTGELEFYDSKSKRPPHTRLELQLSDDRFMAFRDPRRFGRILLQEKDPRSLLPIKKLGFDPLEEIPSLAQLEKLFKSTKRNIKALLLDQRHFAGVGNWIADEILFQAKIHPAKLTAKLSTAEILKIRSALKKIIEKAVSVNSESQRFPKNWLYHKRWNLRKTLTSSGHEIVRETIGGRTTAYVPAVQK